MTFSKILVPHQHKIFVIEYNSIMFLKSDNCYTHIYLDDGRNFTVTKSLSTLERHIKDKQFIRISQSFLVNRNFISCIDRKLKIISVANQHSIPYTISVKQLSSLIIDEGIEVVEDLNS
ncbi:hypothetical protein DCC81_25235 [Chitinophaga parva]|uniref:HTH LytTR-type domain-containing protein n=1 Tax=Chitinophaga parva TaxID=2169414 RepID=A0A2T7BB98_9BACT|nr:hypothetical protein DCC81_25235 [Chitinophaga parva]